MESQPLYLTGETALTEDSRAQLETLFAVSNPPPFDWEALLQLGLLRQVLSCDPMQKRIKTGPTASKILDAGPNGWSRSILESWVEGQGPHNLDRAQNQLFGIPDTWLATIRNLHFRPQSRRTSLVGWWQFSTRNASVTTPSNTPPQTPQRPVPTWIHAPGISSTQDEWQLPPNMEQEREHRQAELILAEGVCSLFRLLLLDLLLGMQGPIGLEALSELIHELAAFSVHLHLAASLALPQNPSFLPMRPPTYIMEALHTESFETFAGILIEDLLLPAGVATWADPSHKTIRLLQDRLFVSSPHWFDDDARQSALASVLQIPENTLPRKTTLRHHLRPVDSSREEPNQRFWLGRPLEQLRRAIAGRPIISLHHGYVEVADFDQTPPSNPS